MDNIKKVKMLDGKEIYFKEENGNFIEVEKPLNRRFKPLNKEIYFFTANDGRVHSDYFTFDLTDDYRSNSNNMFKTKEEAERKLEITRILHEHSHDYSLKEWENSSIPKYFIYVDFCNSQLNISDHLNTSSALYHFKTYSNAKEAMDLIGYDDYLKYVLGIYEE